MMFTVQPFFTVNLTITDHTYALTICRTLDKVVESMVKNFSEGTEYFKVMTHYTVLQICSRTLCM